MNERIGMLVCVGMCEVLRLRAKSDKFYVEKVVLKVFTSTMHKGKVFFLVYNRKNCAAILVCELSCFDCSLVNCKLKIITRYLLL